MAASIGELSERISARWAHQSSITAAASADDLGRQVAPRDDPCWPPPGTRRVADSLHVVLDEEWWHHRYTVRDLASLEN